MAWLRTAALLLCCAFGHAMVVSESDRLNSKFKELQVGEIEPELQPTSDKQFFGKKGDFASDDRPKATGLHFDHPYPHVQDTGDYDKDYVKDENDDNGSWEAQTEYDRLRQKLLKEKQDVADALARKIKNEEAVRKAAERQQAAEDAAARLKKLKDAIKVEDKSVEPAGAAGVATASADTEDAMANLKDCKEELEQARAQLKEAMEKLDAAKEKEDMAQRYLDEKEAAELAAATREKELEEKVKKEEAESEAAKLAYEKQKAKVEQMEKELLEAQQKVAAIRAGADANGGVYPTKSRSGAPASVSPFAGFTLTALMALVAAPY